MTPEQEKNMRDNISDHAHTELINMAIALQNTIDTHVSEKEGFRSSISQLGKQNAALVQENEQMEGGASSEDSERLQARVTELEELNDGLQRTIVKLT